MYWWLLVPGLVALFYLAVPLLIWKTFRIESAPTFQRIDLASMPLPTEVKQHLDAVEAELQGLGFEAGSTLLLPSTTPNVISMLRHFVNRKEKTVAMANSVIVTVKSEAGDQVRHQPYVEFSTRCGDGQVFNTLNSLAAGSFPSKPQSLTTRVPWILDVTQLYKIHSAIITARSGGARRILRLDESFNGDEIAFLQACMKDEMEHAMKVGYVQLPPGSNHYVATLRGAYLMTWKELPPFKQWRERRSRARAERLVREVGVA